MSDRRPLSFPFAHRSSAPLVAASIAALGSVWAPATAHADPGELTAIEIGTNGSNFGYFEYLPAAYDESQEWPLLVFLSGIGENGTGTLPQGQDECVSGPNYPGPVICRNLRHGPQNLLWRQLELGQPGLWDDEERPFVLISPQNPAPLYELQPYNTAALDTFFSWVLENYAIDASRMYLMGMSMGGYSSLLYIAAYPDRFAAVAPMPGIPPGGTTDICDLVGQNLWVFHGEDDTNPFSPFSMANLIRLYRGCEGPRPEPRITMYADSGHDVWTRTIDPPQGMDDAFLETYFAQGEVDLDPYDVDVYTWLLMHDRPEVSAGDDLEITTADAPFTLTATTLDDDPIAYTWTQTAGDPLTVEGTSSAGLVLTSLPVGTYTFEVLAVDSDGQFDRDDVVVTVGEAPAETGDEAESSSDGAESAASGSDGSPGESEESDESDDVSPGDGTETGETTGAPGEGSSGNLDGESGTSVSPGSSGADELGPDGSASGGSSSSLEESSVGVTDTEGDTDASASGASTSGASTSDASTSATGTSSTGTSGGSGTGDTTGATSTTATASSGGESSGGDEGGSVDDGCNCATQSSPARGSLAPLLGLLGLAGLRRRRFRGTPHTNAS